MLNYWILLISVIIAIIHIAYISGYLGATMYRITLFWFGCLPIRLFLTMMARNMGNQYLALGTGAISLGLLRAWFIDEPKKKRGEILTSGGFGYAEGTAYWHDRRLIHALLYGLFTAMYLGNVEGSWLILLADTMIGGLTSIQHYNNWL